MSRLFGTDGVRGVANEELSPLLAMQLGQAGAYVLTKENEHKPLWSAAIREYQGICWPTL